MLYFIENFQFIALYNCHWRWCSRAQWQVFLGLPNLTIVQSPHTHFVNPHTHHAKPSCLLCKPSYPLCNIMKTVTLWNMLGIGGHCSRFTAHSEILARLGTLLPKFLLSTLPGATQHIPLYINPRLDKFLAKMWVLWQFRRIKNCVLQRKLLFPNMQM